MSRRANPALIGVFVVVAVTIALAGIVILGGGRWLRQTERYVLYFRGNLEGLDVGAPVAFQGFRIGTVSEIRMVCNTDTGEVLIPVYIELEPRRVRYVGESAEGLRPAFHAREGLRAQLQSQSFVTGKLLVMLLDAPDTAARLVDADPTVPEIPTIPTITDSLAAQFRDFPLDDMVANVHTTLHAAAAMMTSGVVQDMLGSLRDASARAEDLMAELQGTVGPLSTNLLATTAQLQAVLARADGLLEEVRPVAADAAQSVPGLIRSLTDSADAFAATQVQFASALEDAQSMLDPRSPTRYQLATVLDRLASAARAMEELADYLQRHPESVLTGKAASARE